MTLLLKNKKTGKFVFRSRVSLFAIARDIRVRFTIDSTLSEIGKGKISKKLFQKDKTDATCRPTLFPFFFLLALEIKKGQHKSLDCVFPWRNFVQLFKSKKKGKKS